MENLKKRLNSISVEELESLVIQELSPVSLTYLGEKLIKYFLILTEKKLKPLNINTIKG